MKRNISVNIFNGGGYMHNFNALKYLTLLIFLTISLLLFVGCSDGDVEHHPQFHTDKVEERYSDKCWIGIGQSVTMKIVEIDGHKYLVTCRDGVGSYNAQTIHAHSCPCMKSGK